MRLAELIANRHPDLRQTLFVEYLIFRNHLVDEEQIGRQRVHLIGSQSPLQPEWHAAIDDILHYRRMRSVLRKDALIFIEWNIRACFRLYHRSHELTTYS